VGRIPKTGTRSGHAPDLPARIALPSVMTGFRHGGPDTVRVTCVGGASPGGTRASDLPSIPRLDSLSDEILSRTKYTLVGASHQVSRNSAIPAGPTGRLGSLADRWVDLFIRRRFAWPKFSPGSSGDGAIRVGVSRHETLYRSSSRGGRSKSQGRNVLRSGTLLRRGGRFDGLLWRAVPQTGPPRRSDRALDPFWPSGVVSPGDLEVGAPISAPERVLERLTGGECAWAGGRQRLAPHLGCMRAA
jgi:hypothetical protein